MSHICDRGNNYRLYLPIFDKIFQGLTWRGPHQKAHFIYWHIFLLIRRNSYILRLFVSCECFSLSSSFESISYYWGSWSPYFFLQRQQYGWVLGAWLKFSDTWSGIIFLSLQIYISQPCSHINYSIIYFIGVAR